MAGRRTDWRGVLAVAATPFTREGAIDEGAFRALMDTLVEGGVAGIVVAGSTGEWFRVKPEADRGGGRTGWLTSSPERL